MREISTSLAAVALALGLVACGDDTVPPADTTTSGTTGTSELSSTGGPEPGTSTGSQEGDGTSTGTPGTTTDDPSTSGATMGTTGEGTTGEGTTGVGSSSEGSSSGDACMPIADGAAIGQDCGPGGAMCPPGYTCQPFVGFAFQETCQIICVEDCECPMGMTCNFTVDKTGVPWFQCG